MTSSIVTYPTMQLWTCLLGSSAGSAVLHPPVMPCTESKQHGWYIDGTQHCHTLQGVYTVPWYVPWLQTLHRGSQLLCVMVSTDKQAGTDNLDSLVMNASHSEEHPRPCWPLTNGQVVICLLDCVPSVGG